MRKEDITNLLEETRIRLVVSDPDGTLLNERKEGSDCALAAIAALRRHGVLFSVCTGREYAMPEAYARKIQPTAPMICNSGGEVIRYPDGEVIARRLLPREESKKPRCTAWYIGTFIVYALSFCACHISRVSTL